LTIERVNGGVLSTAGDLVFQGNGSGIFAAYDADSGVELWRTDAGIGIIAPPISYAVAGEQYVAVMVGIGGTPALNYLDLTYENDGRVLAFKLGGRGEMPPVPPRKPGVVDAPTIPADAEVLAQGESLYSTHCARCHGVMVRGSGFLPDLRHSSRPIHDSWDSIVRGGAFRAKGMAGFGDLIDEAESRAIHAYVAERAHSDPTLVDQLFEWARENICIPTWMVAD
jgi:quinohemoprotein ethanol dehydrogenase